MDLHFNKPEFEDGRVDFHRFVLLFAHSFTDRIRFVGELELEHALVEGLEEAGELELEQAYIDFLLTRAFNVRGGMMLMPIGIIGERHEPPSYYGVERPFVDTVIVPTTWFEVGAGIHGEVGRGWRYRAFVTAPLNAAEFNADEGVREGRQKGANANMGRPAATGRVEYVGYPGLTVGASAWTGRSGFEFRPRFDVPGVAHRSRRTLLACVRVDLRGQFAQSWLGNAGRLNDTLAVRIGVNPNIGRSMRGFYTEAGYRVISGARFGDVGAFVRYENFHTQFKMPQGYGLFVDLSTRICAEDPAAYAGPALGGACSAAGSSARSHVHRTIRCHLLLMCKQQGRTGGIAAELYVDSGVGGVSGS